MNIVGKLAKIDHTWGIHVTRRLDNCLTIVKQNDLCLVIIDDGASCYVLNERCVGWINRIALVFE